MGFKEQSAKDLAVFFNIKEFAELHTVNGVQFTCIVDSDVNQVRSGIESEQYDGIFLVKVKLYAKKTDITKRPAHGKLLRLDDKPYTVIDCTDEMGVWVITLGLNDS